MWIKTHKTLREYGEQFYFEGIVLTTSRKEMTFSPHGRGLFTCWSAIYVTRDVDTVLYVFLDLYEKSRQTLLRRLNASNIWFLVTTSVHPSHVVCKNRNKHRTQTIHPPVLRPLVYTECIITAGSNFAVCPTTYQNLNNAHSTARTIIMIVCVCRQVVDCSENLSQ